MMDNPTTLSPAEAFNHINDLLKHMEDNKFSPLQINAVKLAQTALLNFELLSIISNEDN